MTMTSGQLRWLAMGLAVSFVPMLASCGANTAKPQTSETQQAEAPAGDEQGKSSSLAQLLEWAESGDVWAQYDLGLSLTETDPKAAQKWFESAALQGQGVAAYQLGLMQDDPKRAIEWYSMASAMGHVGAQYQLGDAYMNGHGTAEEPGWGRMWFERAARAGNADAQFAMGMTMADGTFGPVQRGEALVWLLIARGNGYPGGGALIEALKTHLSEAAIATAEQRASSWTNEPASESAGDRSALRFAQYALGRLGFDAGPADGLSGDLTETAIAAFRATEGLRAGDLDGQMLDMLRERLALQNR